MKEICICSAIKMPDGYIVRGHRHSDCFYTAMKIPRYNGIKLDSLPDGFVTSRNRFVNRTEARMIQEKAGIKSVDLHGYTGRYTLYSEDLY